MDKEDVRSKQAAVLFGKGWSEWLGYTSFVEYLSSIPDVPPWFEDPRFDRVKLVDARIPLLDAARCAGLICRSANYDEYHVLPMLPAVYWIHCQDGRRHHGKKFGDIRYSFRDGERGMRAIEGVALYAQDPTVLTSHLVELPLSFYREYGRRGRHEYIAKLRLEYGVPGLFSVMAGVGRRQNSGIASCVVLGQVQ